MGAPRLAGLVLLLAGCSAARSGLGGGPGGDDLGADAISSHDLGVDAPPGDLGPPDLAPPDDLGPPDLGPPDLGPPDLGPPDLGCPPYYRDGDADGHGDPTMATIACAMPVGYVAVADDCNDADLTIHPGAPELCNGRDENCDGVIDDGATCPGCTVATYGGHTYLFCDTTHHSFNFSETTCQGFGYHLATIEDEPEDGWVAMTARAIDATGWWIGYTELGGPYHWLAGTSTYTGWGPGEPSHGTEHCALEAWLGGVAHSWNDGDCGMYFPFVCEVPP